MAETESTTAIATATTATATATATATTTATTTNVGTIVFLKVLGAIIISWILIHLWTTVIDVYTFEYLGLSQTSLKHTTSIAVVATILFIIYVNLCGNETNVIQNRMTGIIAQPLAVEDSIVG